MFTGCDCSCNVGSSCQKISLGAEQVKNRVFAFGDKISPGKQTDVFVAFNVDDIPGGMLSGPFDDRVQAEEEAYDIKSYEHVFNVRIVTRADMKIKIHRRKSEKEKHVAETAEIAPKHDD